MIKNGIRQCAHAGSFYPADATPLRQMIASFIDHAQANPTQANHIQTLSNNEAMQAPKAIIAPHAGYIYSGPVAASAYARLRMLRHRVSRVVLLGPSHQIPFTGFTTSSAHFFATPLGNVPLDRPTIDRINLRHNVTESDQAHALEHSLEVHLPFLQITLNDFQLTPIVVGDASPNTVSELLIDLWGGTETLIVISSDLSHYHQYDTAQRLDTVTSKAIESFDIATLSGQSACGFVPINGLLKHAGDINMRVKTIDCRNSADTAGSRDRVVGYGAYVFAEQ